MTFFSKVKKFSYFFFLKPKQDRSKKSCCFLSIVDWPFVWEQLLGIYKMNLSNYLQTSVEIKKNKNGKGKIIVDYQDEDNLEDIIKNKILR